MKKLSRTLSKGTSGRHRTEPTFGQAQKGKYGIPINSRFLQKQMEVAKALTEQTLKRQQARQREYQYMSRREFLEYIECTDADGYARKLHGVSFYLNGMGRLIDLVVHLSKELRRHEERLQRDGGGTGGGEQAAARGRKKTAAASGRPRYEAFDGKIRTPLGSRDRDDFRDHRRILVEGDEPDGDGGAYLRPDPARRIEITRGKTNKRNGGGS